MLGFIQTGLFGGAINADSPPYSAQHNFSSKISVWSYATLQEMDCNSDDAYVNMWVNNFDGALNPNTQHHPGIVAHNCSWVQFGLQATDCLFWAALTSVHFE
jgi:hypothetical protein